MSFHATSEDISLKDNHVLKAKLFNKDGEAVDAEINLNDFIGNNNGSFEWGGTGFSDSAEGIFFSLEGDDNCPVLRARLFNVDGEAVDANINLAERLGNDNGQFSFCR